MDIGRALLAGAGVGASLTYFLDPRGGARRRARVRDIVAHVATKTSRTIGTTTRDGLHRTYGTAASICSLARRQPVDDRVLVERVRAKLGRFVSHPHAISVVASSGAVTLQGPILQWEAPRLVRAVRRVRGVRQVIDNLELHERAAGVPSLQGGRAPAGDRVDLLQKHWAPTTRALIGTAGTALVFGGILRRDVPRSIAVIVGVGLIARAATNQPLHQLVGLGPRRSAIHLQKTIPIHAPVG
jgi:hypothetical protein